MTSKPYFDLETHCNVCGDPLETMNGVVLVCRHVNEPTHISLKERVWEEMVNERR